MLIIGREIGKSVIIGEEIKVTVIQKGSKLCIIIEAPKNIQITRVKQSPEEMKRIKNRTRKVGETMKIGDMIKVTILQTESGLIRFAIDAPKEISVIREEIYQKKYQAINSLNHQTLKVFDDYCLNYG
jgi:carbon storage regulator CsrA